MFLTPEQRLQRLVRKIVEGLAAAAIVVAFEIIMAAVVLYT